MVVDDGNDLLALLVFVPREANAIAPFLATVLVPSPWSTRRSRCFSSARWATLAINACSNDPSSAAPGKFESKRLDSEKRAPGYPQSVSQEHIRSCNVKIQLPRFPF